MSTLFSFFYIYDPWFFHFLRMSFVIGAVAAIYAFIKNKNIILPLYSMLLIISLIVISSIFPIINNTQDYSVVIMYIKILIMFCFGGVIYNSCYNYWNEKEKYIRDLEIGIYIQAAIGAFALIGFDLAVKFALSVHVSLDRFYGSEQEYRLYNVTSSAFFQLSIFYFFLLHFLLAAKYEGYKVSNLSILSLLFIGVLSGRTFLFLAFFSILFYYFRLRHFPIVIVAILSAFLIYSIFQDNTFIQHMVEPIINIIDGKDIDEASSSSKNLIDNFYLPSLGQTLFGDGYYHNIDGSYYGYIDSGLVRQLLYGGVSYLLLCLFFTYFFIKRIALNWFGNKRRFIFSSMFILSVAHIKADVFAYPGILLFLIIFTSFFSYKRI